MELTLAILIVFGIFVGVPFIIGLAIGSVYMVHERRALNAEQGSAVEKAEEIVKTPARKKTHVKVV